MRRTDSLEKTLNLEMMEGKRRRGQQKIRGLDSVINSMHINVGKLQEMEEDRGTWHAAVRGNAKSQT